ncbi:MAG: hypothetical protein ACXVFM_13010 [Solirubrobacteraceae bacterium]
MCSPRSTHAVALGLVLAALAPATALAGNELRSPDARDPFVAPATTTPDLRSPDARDAAAGRSAAGSPSVLVVKIPQHRTAGAGMDWGDAVIGAGGAVAVLALTAGGTLALQRRRHVASARTPAAV